MRRGLAGALTLAACARGAAAQPSVSVGDRVRLDGRPATSRSAGAECDGRVSALPGDTIVLAGATTSRLCPRWTYAPSDVRQLRVMHGDRGSRGTHAAAGLAIGAVALGGLAALAVPHDGCGEDSSCGDVRALAAIFFGLSGGAVGAVVGAVLPAGPRWVTIPVTGPVRIAGVEARPAVRVGRAAGR